MAQPLIGSDNEEYSCAVFADGKCGFSAHITLRRKLSPLGFTEKAEVVDGSDVMQAVSALCFHFNPVGPTNFQFRVHKGELKLLEINPRISSSTSIRAAFGYNEPAMAVDFFLNGTRPTQPEIKRGRAVRYWEDYVFKTDSINPPPVF
jgi:carbamoyl-phosphate synthase large subunit